ncbi:GGDEF domain-containing protein [uncultured Roseobacter sp.]|uniref:GGDEF domain-containing protein n=1 Tax=uncultured Roseobacter sp. TaxID=114847 RepID=UPI002614EA87|nr:GGDEF domain-containing protein [uncultured Roseobacter sp.]
MVDIDHFPCGCLITTRDQKIVFSNQYFEEELGWNAKALESASVHKLLTTASVAYCNSYIVPTVLKEGRCCESQLSVVDIAGARHPKVVSVRRLPNGNFAWVFVEAEKRDKLFHELESTRLELQSQKEKLEQLSLTDALTGVANRRAFDAAARRIFAEADRSEAAVTILMMDIDNFKSINDAHGHKVGDEALLTLSDVLKATCRAVDTIARVGGDEFVCILPNSSLEDAKLVCKRIHMALADRVTGVCRFTVSIGASCRPATSSRHFADMLKLADMALYEAKKAGRNQTRIQEPKPSAMRHPD